MDNKNGILLMTILFNIINVSIAINGGECKDWKGETIEQGYSYVPDETDPCKTCSCAAGGPTACHSVSCSPPNCLTYQQIKGECCKFICVRAPSDGDVDDFRPQDETRNRNITNHGTPTNLHPDRTNLSLRLLASTLTTMLLLALVIFMIHRLRQRRILTMMRRMQRCEEEESVSYVAGFTTLDGQIAYPPYDDPPPPYSLIKPPEVILPPPYESTERLDRDNNNVNAQTSHESGRTATPQGERNSRERSIEGEQRTSRLNSIHQILGASHATDNENENTDNTNQSQNNTADNTSVAVLHDSHINDQTNDLSLPPPCNDEAMNSTPLKYTKRKCKHSQNKKKRASVGSQTDCRKAVRDRMSRSYTESPEGESSSSARYSSPERHTLPRNITLAPTRKKNEERNHHGEFAMVDGCLRNADEYSDDTEASTSSSLERNHNKNKHMAELTRALSLYSQHVKDGKVQKEKAADTTVDHLGQDKCNCENLKEKDSGVKRKRRYSQSRESPTHNDVASSIDTLHVERSESGENK